MFRIVLVITLATICGAVGQIMLRHGMQLVGSLESYAPLELLDYFGGALLQPYVLAGTALNGVMYFCLLAALSWADVTIVFPLTALEYGFAALLAVTFLREAVPPERWAGIALVVIGVILIGSTGGDQAGARPQANTIAEKVEGD